MLRRLRKRIDASWLQDLGPWARLSIIGLLVAAALAIGLGWFIPRWVGGRFLETQAQADQVVLEVLTETEALVEPGGSDFETLDAFVHSAILAGDIVRVKLWRPDGTIAYSDEPELIGRSFTPDVDFATLDEPVSHRSDLDADENLFERDEFDAGLLETYVPVRDGEELLAVWEVYHLLAEHDAAVAETRRAVWLSVGSGLGLLAVFLVSVFGGLVASVQRRRREAEAHSGDLGTLLNVVRSSANALDRGQVVADVVQRLQVDGEFDCVVLTHRREPGEATVLASAGTADCLRVAPEPPGCDRQRAEATLGPGALVLTGCRSTSQSHAATAALLEATVEELRVAIDRADLYADLESHRARLQHLMERLVSAQESERRRIVGEIHDGLGQDLHRVLFGIRGCLSADPEETVAELEVLEDLVATSSRRLRRLLQELHPSVVEDIGLAASLRSLADRMREQYGLRVELELADFGEPSIDVRLAMFRIAQEALMNTAKHSGSDRGRVQVAAVDGHLELKVSDLGSGIASGRGDGLGTWLMRERAESLGGTLEIIGTPPGTSVRARIPLEVTRP